MWVSSRSHQKLSGIVVEKSTHSQQLTQPDYLDRFMVLVHDLRSHDTTITNILFKRTLKIMKRIFFIFHLVLEIFRLMWYSNEMTYDVRFYTQILTYWKIVYIFNIIERNHLKLSMWDIDPETEEHCSNFNVTMVILQFPDLYVSLSKRFVFWHSNRCTKVK